MHTAIIKALEERQRQINEEGFTAERDDQYLKGELAYAAACYSFAAKDAGVDLQLGEADCTWPWAKKCWKPSPDPKRNIIKAMALLSAEYDRLERAEAAASQAYALEYLYSTDDEWQESSYDDLHDLIVDRDREAGDVVYMGIKRDAVATDYTHQLAESVIENMQVQAEDDAGEIAESFPEVSLQRARELQALIDAWATAYCTPGFYTLINVQEITITERDVLLANQECN